VALVAKDLGPPAQQTPTGMITAKKRLAAVEPILS
jgi:hypothetical protein